VTGRTREQSAATRASAADGIARCEFCSEKIRWAWPVPSPKARTEAGRNPKPIPLDHEPNPLGRYTIYNQGGRDMVGELTRGQHAGWLAAGKPTYQRHFRTCAKKDQWGKLGKPYGTKQVTR
jgi:hypothetical protein